ncbi:MAG TPA: HIT family protein [Methylophilaceae bacterium]|jgi:diadenosine tetraphosphate (Ap4A) HIT family hydrolase
MASCELCSAPGGELIWQDGFCRVVRINDADYPGFCRVILNRHIKEMSDLESNQREQLMTVVFVVEQAVRDIVRPDKINLASLGNKTPHLHWHVIPRFVHDRHFPDPIWSAGKRETPSQQLDDNTAQQLKTEIQRMLG